MHYSAEQSLKAFLLKYGGNDKHVIDLGGADLNGSVRKMITDYNMKYTCVDIEKNDNVDIVVKPGEKLPFHDESIDLIISTSCFEHDPCFWLTFKEFTRLIKKDGYIYVNVPSIGDYHVCPGDNWRFYSDAGQALAYWSGIQMGNETVFPVKIEETFHIDGLYSNYQKSVNKYGQTEIRTNHQWDDFICVWKRTDIKETEITVSDHIRSYIGPIEKILNDHNIRTKPFITPILGLTNEDIEKRFPLTCKKYYNK
jgi:predicted SAM-dependent methyltransferase